MNACALTKQHILHLSTHLIFLKLNKLCYSMFKTSISSVWVHGFFGFLNYKYPFMFWILNVREINIILYCILRYSNSLFKIPNYVFITLICFLTCVDQRIFHLDNLVELLTIIISLYLNH